MSFDYIDQTSEPFSGTEAVVLVAANRQPGLGLTGAKEERVVGQSPALAITSPLKPVLASDEAVITSAFPIRARWKGRRREARISERLSKHERPRRRYVSADALPPDDERMDARQRPRKSYGKRGSFGLGLTWLRKLGLRNGAGWKS